MPSSQDANRQSDGGEFERGEEGLVGGDVAEEALGRLGETEDGAEVDEEAGGGDGEDEDVLAAPEGGFVVVTTTTGGTGEGEAEEEEDEQEGGEGERLQREAGEQDVVARGGVLFVGFRRADEGGAGDLHGGRQDVRRDEAPQDELPRQPPAAAVLVFVLVVISCCCCCTASTIDVDLDGISPGDEPGDGEVDARGDEDGRDDDEEVLHHEPNHVVGVVPGRERAERVADRFEQAGEGHEQEGPGAVADYLEEMDDCAEGEEDDGDDAEGEGGGVSFFSQDDCNG